MPALSGIEPVEIIRFGITQYLYPVRMDEIEMADYPLCRLSDGIIVELPPTTILTSFPGEPQLLSLVYK